MSDWMDFLQGLSGAALGVTKGATIGMEPFAAWEKVRSADLANDKSDVQLRDLYGVQDAREAYPNYYQDLVEAANSGYRKATAGNERGIFGEEQALALQKYLADPYGAFQEHVAAAGMRPDSPEFRNWLAQAIGQYDPMAAVKAQDSFGVPAIEQRNVNEQAVLAYVQQYARKLDPGARVIRNEDGTIAVQGSNGEVTPVSGDVLTKVAAMFAAKTPYDAQQQGLADMLKIITGNINNAKGVESLAGNTPAAATIKLLGEQRMNLKNALDAATRDLVALQAAASRSMEPDTFAPQIEQARARVSDINTAMQDLYQQQLYLMQRSMSGGSGISPGTFVGPPSSLAGPTPQGRTTMTTRPPAGAAASRATGRPGGGGGVPLGVPMSGNQAVPFAGMTPGDIWGMPSLPIRGQ